MSMTDTNSALHSAQSKITSFSWKRKIGDKIAKDSVSKAAFADNEVDTHDSSVFHGTSLSSKFKRKKSDLSDNCRLKSEELKTEGIKLAENGHYFEAVSVWDQALRLTPSDAKLLEMKAQALLQVNEALPALQAARKALMIDPLWWVAHQTLGRAQLGVGEIEMAIASFSKAVHINPTCEELWTDDLNWAVKLLCEKKKLAAEQTQSAIGDKNSSLNTVNEPEDNNPVNSESNTEDSQIAGGQL